MAQSLFMQEYVGRYLEKGPKEEGEKRADRLGSRMRIVDEGFVPMYPRFLWLEARFNFVFQQDVACILLCSAAVEAALKAFLGEYFRRKLKVRFDLALDEMEIRSLLAACQSLQLIEESTVKMIRQIGDIRHEYVHSKIEQIANKVKARIEKEEKGAWDGLDDMGRELFVAGMAGEDKSYETLELLERIFKAVFQDSQYAIW
jgi:hypothetical protein